MGLGRLQFPLGELREEEFRGVLRAEGGPWEGGINLFRRMWVRMVKLVEV